MPGGSIVLTDMILNTLGIKNKYTEALNIATNIYVNAADIAQLCRYYGNWRCYFRGCWYWH